jgi:transcriptional regulator with XRE-family HTH domain
MQAQALNLSETLRDRLARHSVRSVSIKSGIDRATLSRFRSGYQSITLETADKLAGVFGLALTPRADAEVGR